MKDELSESQTTAILKALDDTIANGPWNESNFLRVIGKNLQEIRDDLAKQIANSAENHLSTRQNQPVMKSGQQEVFISIYSAEGNLLQSWERIIANLPRQMISRPIYSEEENVTTLIKSKENKLNEAYVAIYVDQSDILMLNPDKIPLDRLGKPLLTIKDRSLNLDNLTRFVHLSGVYKYVKGKLVKIDK